MSLGRQLTNMESRIKTLEETINLTTNTTQSVSFDMAALKEAVDQQISGSLEAAKNEANINARLMVEAGLVELKQAIQDAVAAQVHTFVQERLESLRNELLATIAASVVVPAAPAPVEEAVPEDA